LVKKAKTSKHINIQGQADPTSPNLRLRPEGTRSEQAAAQLSLARRQARYGQVIELAKQGKSQRQIVRELRINRQTVRHYLAAGGPPSKGQHSKTKPSILAPYYTYLEQRWQAGCDNAAQLRREIEAQGYKGSRQVVQMWVAMRRKMANSPAIVSQPALEVRLPGLTKLSWLLSRHQSELNKSDLAVLDFIKEELELKKGWVLSQRFRELLGQKDLSKFRDWLIDCLNSGVSELVSFAQGLERDQAAIEAGITSRFSNERPAYCTSCA
jgi:transposase